MTDNTTRTPQPGDVWESPSRGLLYCTTHMVGPVLIPLPTGNMSSGIRVEAIDIAAAKLSYLGRASDMIGEALAKRGKRTMTEQQSLQWREGRFCKHCRDGYEYSFWANVCPECGNDLGSLASTQAFGHHVDVPYLWFWTRQEFVIEGRRIRHRYGPSYTVNYTNQETAND